MEPPEGVDMTQWPRHIGMLQRGPDQDFPLEQVFICSVEDIDADVWDSELAVVAGSMQFAYESCAVGVSGGSTFGRGVKPSGHFASETLRNGFATEQRYPP